MIHAFALPVLAAIRSGRSYDPIPRCGARLRYAREHGLIRDDYYDRGGVLVRRVIPVLTPAGDAVLEGAPR